MLALTRKVGQAIVIGDGIKVHVTKVTPTRVTLAIDAPQGTRILRDELEPHAVTGHATRRYVRRTEA